jgi:integrase/recombinase XerD
MKKARTLSKAKVEQALSYKGNTTQHRVMLLLSIAAGLRAIEIAGLRWKDIDWDEEVLRLKVTKRGLPREVPMNAELRKELSNLFAERGLDLRGNIDIHVILSPSGEPTTRNAVSQWFSRFYRKMDWEGYSSHSGRRTFVTRAAEKIFEAGGTLRDVQALAGHKDLATTQIYIDTNPNAQKKIVEDMV